MQKRKGESAEYQAGLSYAEGRIISMMEHQNAKERAQRQACLIYAERRSISMMEHQNAKEREQKQTCLSYAERRSISMMKYKNTKTQKCKTYRKLLIKYKIHFASFAKPLHFLCKKVFLELLAVGFFSLGFRILEFRHKY